VVLAVGVGLSFGLVVGPERKSENRVREKALRNSRCGLRGGNVVCCGIDVETLKDRGLYLEQVSIKGFRLFQELELKLNQGLNVLVGENDSGKTALIDAIRYTLGANSSERSYTAESDFHEEENFLSIQLKFSNVDKAVSEQIALSQRGGFRSVRR
jgi:ATPase subunit of ABC transporter with duplicated ATPase domains